MKTIICDVCGRSEGECNYTFKKKWELFKTVSSLTEQWKVRLDICDECMKLLQLTARQRDTGRRFDVIRVITDQRITNAKKIAENDKHLYDIVAFGDTFNVREDLKAWNFTWDSLERLWTRHGAPAYEKVLFEQQMNDKAWPNIRFTFYKNPITLKESKESDKINKTKGDK